MAGGTMNELANVNFSEQTVREKFIQEISESDVSIDTLQTTYFTADEVSGRTGLELLMDKISNTSLSGTYSIGDKKALMTSIHEKIISPVFNALYMPVSDKPQGMHVFLNKMCASDLPDELKEIALLTVIDALQKLTPKEQIASLLQKDTGQITLLQKILYQIHKMHQLDAKTSILNKFWNVILQPKIDSIEDTAAFFNVLLETIDLPILELLMQNSPSFRRFALSEKDILVNGAVIKTSVFFQHFSSKITPSLDIEKWADILIIIHNAHPAMLAPMVKDFLQPHDNALYKKWLEKNNAVLRGSYDNSMRDSADVKAISVAIRGLLSQLLDKNPSIFVTVLHLFFTQNNLIELAFRRNDFNLSAVLFNVVLELIENTSHGLSAEQVVQLNKIKTQLSDGMISVFDYKFYELTPGSELAFMQNIYSSLEPQKKISVLTHFDDVAWDRSRLYDRANILLIECFKAPEFSWAMAVALCEIKRADVSEREWRGFNRCRYVCCWDENGGYSQFAHDLEYIECNYASASGSLGELLNGDPKANYFSRSKTRQRIMDKKIMEKSNTTPDINKRDAGSLLLNATQTMTNLTDVQQPPTAPPLGLLQKSLKEEVNNNQNINTTIPTAIATLVSDTLSNQSIITATVLTDTNNTNTSSKPPILNENNLTTNSSTARNLNSFFPQVPTNTINVLPPVPTTQINELTTTVEERQLLRNGN